MLALVFVMFLAACAATPDYEGQRERASERHQELDRE